MNDHSCATIVDRDLHAEALSALGRWPLTGPTTVMVADVALGFIQEYRAQRTYTALQSLLIPTTTVIRDGQRQEVERWELVPGDGDVLEAAWLFRTLRIYHYQLGAARIGAVGR